MNFYKFRERPIENRGLDLAITRSTTTLKVAARLLNDFVELPEGERVDEIHIVYTHFVNRVVQEPRVIRVVPLRSSKKSSTPRAARASGGEEGGTPVRPLYDFEPDAETTLDALLPRLHRALGACCATGVRSQVNTQHVNAR